MGTRGSGPFDSDAAEDFADRLTALTVARRTERVRSRLRRAGEGLGAHAVVLPKEADAVVLPKEADAGVPPKQADAGVLPREVAGAAGVLPGEVLAAAAVVAASLPAGANLPWNEEYEGIESWLNQDEIDDLARLADRALEATFPDDGRRRVDPGDLGTARTVLDLLHLVLRAHLELKPRFR